MTAAAVAYIRVSTSDQHTSGLGEAAQESAVRACAARLGLTLQEPIYRDVMTGTDKKALENREGLMGAIAALKRGSVLLVAKLDRISRGDIVAAAMVERLVLKKGARILSVGGEGTGDDDPSSVLMRRICQGFAEYEAALISMRTKAALRAKRARGERAGSTPFGFAVADEESGRLEPIPAQQATLAAMRGWREAGLSYQDIARELNEQGYDPQRGRKWWPSSVRAVLATAGKAEAKT